MGLSNGDIIELSYRGSCLDQMILFITHAVIDATSTGRTVDQDMAELLSFWNNPGDGGFLPLYAANLATNYTAARCRVQNIRPVRRPYIESVTGITGGGTGAAKTANVGGTMTMVGPGTGRSQVATYHIGPIGDADMVLGYLSEGLQATIDLFAQSLIGQKTVGTHGLKCSFTILHPANAIPQTADFENYRVGQTVRVDRRRTVGLGI